PGPAPAAEAPVDRRRVPDVRPDLTEQPTTPPRSAPATAGGLPVRSPGRTMAAAERERREQHRRTPDRPVSAPRDAGSSFGAFHRGRRGGAAGTEPPAPG
ncbi:ATP-binding protein, partial [Streptomyces sp. NPDC058832]